MRVLVVSIDHSWQVAPRDNEPAALKVAKAQLTQLLTKTISDRGVNLICEESDPSKLSIAQKMAYEHRPRIPWRNIMMSAQQRLEVGIWEALEKRPKDVWIEDDGMHTKEYRIPEDDIRERFFCDETLAAAASVAATSVLILCGDMHMDAVSAKLAAKEKYQVETNRALVPEKYWE